MKNEPTVEQLEKLIETYRKIGGSDAEISLLAREIIYDFAPDKIKPIDEVFPKEHHESIAKIHDFKRQEIHPVKHAFKDLWAKRLFKYSLVFVIVFIAIFVVLNFPLIKAKIWPEVPKQYETVKEVIRPTTAKSAPLEPGETIPAGDSLLVPKIAVNAPIVFSNSYSEKVIDADLQKGVVHYFNTANPGEVGNVFITGHSSNYWWNKGKYNYVFANLNRLEIGDQAKIYYQGNKYLYQVTGKKTVEPSDLTVLAQTDSPTMTLMTCTPPGTNWKRLIISFKQVSPQYVEPTVVERQQEINTTKLPSTDSGFFSWFGRLFSF
jgi:LPXTG-site transpeptidase (sortase) family protein